MKNLPNKFQFRVSHLPGFTHTAAKNANGDYEVKWARGYPNHIRAVPRMVFSEDDTVRQVDSGGWVVVGDVQALPEVIYFKTQRDNKCEYALTKQADGRYGCHRKEDKWGNHNAIYSVEDINGFFNGGNWIRIEDELKLPDDFYFQLKNFTDEEVFRAKRQDEHSYRVTWQSDERGIEGCLYSNESAYEIVSCGAWKILDKKPPTAEQERQLKEFKEQVAQLDASIRIAEQTIEHHNRMVANYEERQEILRNKINSLEGV